MINTQGLQTVSILIEFAVFILGMMFVLFKRKVYGWGIILTFGIYIFYDLAIAGAFNVSQGLLRNLFFVASLSIFWVLWEVYKDVKKK